MAEPAALAALAAQNQGKFWEMHDAIFDMKTQITPEKLESAAQEIGLDMQKFNMDRTSQEVKQKLARDVAEAQAAQVKGTPTLFINGRRINDRSPDALQRIIESEAAKAQQNNQ